MAKFTLTDKHTNFANAVAGGMRAAEAYKKHVAVKLKGSMASFAVTASRLMARPEMQALIEKAKKERQDAILKAQAQVVAKEFSTHVLNVDQLDAYHSAIIQGLVEVEEVIPVVTTIYDNDTRRQVKRTTSFMRVKRSPNIREKQISIDALYKRNGNYAPNRLFGAFKNLPDEEPGENVARFVLLSSGERIPLPS